VQTVFSAQNLSLVWVPLRRMILSFGFCVDCRPVPVLESCKYFTKKIDLPNRCFLVETEVDSLALVPLQTHYHLRHQCRISPLPQTTGEQLSFVETS
jgi:hypothetical protein